MASVAADSRVLLVEDNQVDAEWARRALNDPRDVLAYGAIDVEHVDRLHAAISRLRGDNIHLVVLDLGLPDGPDDALTVEQVHSARPSIPIIVYSGSEYERSGLAALDKGALYFFPKSSNDRRWFARTVRQALERYRMQENMRRIIESSADGMAIFETGDGRFLFGNPAAHTMLGITDREAEVIAPFPLDRDRLDRVALANSNADINLVRLEWYGRPAVLASMRDVTRQIITEKQLRQTQKMEAIGLLAGGLAHDLNNVIGVISGYARLVQDALHESSPARGDLHEIQLAGERASTLIRRLLSISRPGTSAAQKVVPDGIVDGLSTLLRGLLGRTIRLLVSTNCGAHHVLVDPTELEQAIVNLVVNARDAMPDGGDLSIETRVVRLEESFREANPDLGPSEEYLMLSVSDTGHGMSEDVMNHMFEPFYTTKGAESGTGLGLATTYSIVKQSGGSIVVTSRLNVGSTFTIYLPCVPASSDEEAVTYQDVAGGAERVLIVEDEAGTRRLASQILRAKGYLVTVVDDSESAAAVVVDTGDAFDLIVTDIVLPGMTGPELIAQLAGHLPGVKVLFVSGYARETVLEQGVIGESDRFLQKPFTPLALCRQVRDTLDSEPGS